MKQLFPIFILLFCLITGKMTAQTSNVRDGRKYDVGHFDKVLMEGNYKVVLVQSDQPYLIVKAPSEDLYDAIDVETDKGSLVLSVRKRNFNLQQIVLHIGFKELRELKISGGVKLLTDGYVEIDDLSVVIEGGANADMKLKSKSLNVKSDGGSVFDLSGVTDQFSVHVAGAGHVNAKEFKAKEVFFRIEGIGFGTVFASQSLDVRIEGVGKVTYLGKPQVKRVVEGLGSVVEY